MTKKRDLRIVFMGTPDFAVATLANLLKQNYNIVGVITAPDKPAGRGKKLKESAVKQFAIKHHLKLLQPTNLKSEEFINELKILNANLQIVVAFRMLPKVVWQMPEFGTFNLHASLLPNYRGAAPIHWAIINGETQTGVTTFFIDEKIDTGVIILKEKININENETVGTLHDKLMTLGSKLVIKTVKLIETNEVVTIPQPKTEGLKTAYKLNKDNCKINWSDDVANIYNKIRGLNPFPTAWCYLEQNNQKLQVKIFDVQKENDLHNSDFGTLIIKDHSIKVACKNGYINIETMQLPGKRKMDVKSLLNGFQFVENAKFS